MRAVLEAAGVRFAYRPGRPALAGVDLALPPGRLVTVLGPNGSGKTTLLRLLLGTLRPGAGVVRLGGRPLRELPLRERARRLSYVPQFPALTQPLTVRELVMLGRFARQGLFGFAGAADEAAVARALARTGAAGLAGRLVGELSGGEAGRVWIARALAQEPEALLLDEPASHLDLPGQVELFRLLRELAGEGVAVGVVSHEINLAAALSDELVLLRAGRVVAAGPPAAVIRAEPLAAAYGSSPVLVAAPGRELPIVLGL